MMESFMLRFLGEWETCEGRERSWGVVVLKCLTEIGTDAQIVAPMIRYKGKSRS